jgi:hypothetical protein
VPDETFVLYIAEDNTKTVVATRRPRINGEATSAIEGGIVELTLVDHQRATPSGSTATVPSTVSTDSPVVDPGGALIGIVVFLVAAVAAVGVCLSTVWWLGVLAGVAAAGVTGYVGSRLYTPPVDDWAQRHVVLIEWSDRDVMRKAHAAVTTISRAWPNLRSITSAPIPDGVLARAVWDLARVLKGRQTLRATHRTLTHSLVDLPRESQMYAEVQHRIRQTADTLTAADADVTERLGHLTDLAERCRRFLREQAALEKARRVVRGVDQVLGAMPGVDAVPAATASEELASSTAAVLGAYRELSLQLGVDDIP